MVALFIQSREYVELDICTSLGQAGMAQSLLPVITITRSGGGGTVITQGDLHLIDFASLPTSDPHVLNALWNNSGVVMISEG